MPKVLVVDDDIDILDAITLILGEEGYEVESTADGKETYVKASYFKPDVIVLDMLLSGVDGRDICKILKGDTATRNIPVVMTSAHPSAKTNAITCGANGFLSKPFDVDDLLKNIKEHLDKHG